MRKLTLAVLTALSDSVVADVVPFDNNNYVEPEVAFRFDGVRATLKPISYEDFKANYTSDTLTAAQIEGITKDLSVYIDLYSGQKAITFDPEPNTAAIGFQTAHKGNVKGFYSDRIVDTKTCDHSVNLELGTRGIKGVLDTVNGGEKITVTCEVTGERLKYGTIPDWIMDGGNVSYNLGASLGPIDSFTEQLWLAMAENPGGVELKHFTEQESAYFSGQEGYEEPIIGVFKLNTDTGKWSFKGRRFKYEELVELYYAPSETPATP